MKKENKKPSESALKIAIINLLSSTKIKQDQENFVENLSMLLNTGMDTFRALSAIEQDVHSYKMKRLVKQMKDDIDAGNTVAKSIEKTELFPPHAISLIEIGEKSGALSGNLRAISIQHQKEKAFRSKVKAAMMYPVLVLAITGLVGLGIAWFVLPRLATVFSQLNLELPWLTEVLINVGQFFEAHGTIAVPSIIAGVTLMSYLLFGLKQTKAIGQRMVFHFPGVKKLIQQIEVARLGQILSTLLHAGLPITDSLQSLHKATVLSYYQNLYAHLKTSIEDGLSFEKSFETFKKSDQLIPIPVQQMIIAGEQSGNLENALKTVGDNYELKTENTTKNLSTILEPILLVIVWLGVVAVALAVILPIYSLVGGLNT